MADYYKCHDMDCWDGETKIGPFVHYPGTPGYTGYTKWVEDNRTQYVKTSYTKIVNEYPEKTEYNLNSNGWTTITNDLVSGTTSTTIPASSFVQGINTLQFKESNAYSTKFDWILYIDQGATPEEYVTSFSYDNYGNVISLTDALENTTQFGYDSHYTYLTSITDALDQTISATYDFNIGLITSITDARGNTTSFEYDILGRVTKKIHPDLTELEAIYNDQDNYVTIYNELDHYTTRYYDGLCRSIKVEQCLSPAVYLTETYTYNYMNKMKTRTDSGGHTYTYEYDSKGRTTKAINPDSTFKQFHYDDTSNTTTMLNENQHKTEYHYNWIDKLVIATVDYKPCGEDIITGEEDPYLYNGKEKDSIHIYYYGARYYDPEIGRFITRDQQWGSIGTPKTLNRYLYCANNPLKYIDPDGRDYFEPEWSHHDEADPMGEFSIKGLFMAFSLWFQKGATKEMAKYGRWLKQHERSNAYAGILGSSAGGYVAGLALGAYFGLVGGAALGVCFYEFSVSSQFYYDLWTTDPQFVGLYTTAEMYANLLVMGVDCGQAATDAFVELEVYILQQKYGDNWRKYAHASTLAYYDEMMKRKQSEKSSSNQQGSSSSGSSPQPQHDKGKIPV